LKETRADYVIMGEGEASFCELAERIERKEPTGAIPGVATSGNIDKIEKRPFAEDLDSLPCPDWEQIDPRLYDKAPHGGLIKNFPVAPVISTRGCPFECAFCASPRLWERTIRFRSPENVVDEIEFLINNYGVREIHFEDDNLTLKRDHIEKICNLLLKRNIKIPWATPNGIRADRLDWELLKLMKQSGCYFLAFGIESANSAILKNVKKNSDPAAVENAVKMAKKLGIITQGFFIFGLPGETEQTMRESLAFAKRTGLDKAQFLIFDVLPGSELWDKLMKDKPVNWNYRSYQEATWVPEGLDDQALRRMLGRAFRSFYCRPRQIGFMLKYMKLNQVTYVIRRVLDYNVLPSIKRQ